MPSDFIIYGPTLAAVKGGEHASGFLNISGFVVELGLAVEDITISPHFSHMDIVPSDFGPNVPAEIMWNLTDVQIQMTLVHYDPVVLDGAMSEAMGGITVNPTLLPTVTFDLAGRMNPAGSVLGNGLPIYASGNHYISLYLLNTSPPPGSVLNASGEVPVSGFEPGYVFPTAYLDSKPLVIPMGTATSKVITSWRAIPYRPIYYLSTAPTSELPLTINGTVGNYVRGEILSSGAIVWERLQRGEFPLIYDENEDTQD